MMVLGAKYTCGGGGYYLKNLYGAIKKAETRNYINRMHDACYFKNGIMP